ncbi:MAG: hypothetical protein LQ340_004316 [Diploschistes diacapsis]|nr:MAG: hypothetical protein LQ340_004316 [Diploschistes diacapsis]
MDSQFSLSVELSKIVPLVPIVNIASRSLLGLVRSFKKSGSDIVTEHDLASIFGRSRIDDAFSRTFRNAVRTSSVHKLAGVAEVVLEAGAGPTVRNAVDKVPFFSMVVQLSALIWGHEIKSLAQSLVQTFTKYHANDLELPTYADMLGTMRCIREQTCGFPWESKFRAVETVLVADLGFTFCTDLRTIPEYILEGLVDALPAVQHWPEEHFIAIQSTRGLSTVIIWAHDLLGLTVEIICDDKSLKFGNGRPNASINCSWTPGSGPMPLRFALLDRTKDIKFLSVPSTAIGNTLWPSNRHPMYGFGHRLFHINANHFTKIHLSPETFAAHITFTALSCALDTKTRSDPVTSCLVDPVPSEARILAASKLIFPHISIESGASLTDCDVPLVLREPRMAYIVDIILAFCMVKNLGDCHDVPISLDHDVQFRSPSITSRNFTYRAYFEFLSLIILGYDDPAVASASVVSAWGWSVVLHSIGLTGRDPDSLGSEVAIVNGVPSRNGERKSFITDAQSIILPTDNVNERWPYKITGRSGDTVSIASFPNGVSNFSYMIGVDENAFIVRKDMHFHVEKNRHESEDLRLELGFRGMQEIYWRSSFLPPCECLNRSLPGQKLVVPSKTWVFQGSPRSLSNPVGREDDPWELQTNPPAIQHNLYAKMTRAMTTPEQAAEDRQRRNEALPARDSECRVHVSSTVGDSTLRWMMLADFYLHRPKARQPRFKAWFLRKDDCCVECAIKYLKDNIKGDNIEFAHVGLIA